jgi:outer membrane lipoprotein-sorting protein
MKFTQYSTKIVAALAIAASTSGVFNGSQAMQRSQSQAGIWQSQPVTFAALLPAFPKIGSRYPAVLDSTARSPLVPRMVSQLDSKVDLALLAKASAAFLQSDRYQTESEIQVQATSGGTEVTSNAKAITTVQSPSQFRSEITFAQPKATAKIGSTVISDGKQVWMYRPDLKQYAVMPVKNFDDSDDNYWIGMSSLWFLQIPAEVRKPIAAGALADPKVQKEMGLSNDLPLTGSKQTVNGQEFYVYEYTDKDGFAIRTFVEPATANLKQVVVTGKSEGYNVVITERILRRTPMPPTTASTFKFSPPKGAKLVKSLSIGPL